ncbi:unnamed protein product, partial [Porites lobata]
TCNVVIDHLRKHKIDKHLESSYHTLKAKTSVWKQQTLKTVLNCKTAPQVEKVKIGQSWIKACCAANTPLLTSGNKDMTSFRQLKDANGDAIQKCSQLRIAKDRNLALIVDELGADQGRDVLDIMAVLHDLDELSPQGNCTIVRTVNEYDIDFDNIGFFNSDTAAYMKKAFQTTLSSLFPLSIHIT